MRGISGENVDGGRIILAPSSGFYCLRPHFPVHISQCWLLAPIVRFATDPTRHVYGIAQGMSAKPVTTNGQLFAVRKLLNRSHFSSFECPLAP